MLMSIYLHRNTDMGISILSVALAVACHLFRLFRLVARPGTRAPPL